MGISPYGHLPRFLFSTKPIGARVCDPQQCPTVKPCPRTTNPVRRPSHPTAVHRTALHQHQRHPSPMWSAATCRRFELGDMSPSPKAQSCHLHIAAATSTPSANHTPPPSLDVGRGGRPQGLLAVFSPAPSVPFHPPPSTLHPRLTYEPHRQNRPSPAKHPGPNQRKTPQRHPRRGNPLLAERTPRRDGKSKSGKSARDKPETENEEEDDEFFTEEFYPETFAAIAAEEKERKKKGLKPASRRRRRTHMKFTHPTAMKPSSPDFKVREPSTRWAGIKRGNLFFLSLGRGPG